MDTKALRQKILDLAIRGKLVPQDPNDEPASVLLERIRAEKQQMVKDGKLKAKDIKNDTVIFKGDDNLHYEQFQDGTVKCIEDEIPFELPDGWAWARLGVICPYGENKAVSADLIDETAWILDLEDIEKETGVIKKYTTKSERNYEKSTHNRRERPIHGHRGGSRGRFYYRITTFEERPWDARDPHKTTFMALSYAIGLSI